MDTNNTSEPPAGNPTQMPDNSAPVDSQASTESHSTPLPDAVTAQPAVDAQPLAAVSSTPAASSSEVPQVAPEASEPAATSVPPTATMEKEKLPFFTLPMKVAFLIIASVAVLGGVVIVQKEKNSPNTTNVSASSNQTPTLAVPTVASDVLDVSPTVVGEIPLEIISPKQGETVSTPNVVITGKTEANATVTINDVEKKADAQGNFSISILIDEGPNIITLTAINENGKYSERELKITLNTGA